MTPDTHTNTSAAAQSDAESVVLPMATPEAADLVCWLWAAIPNRDGAINITRAADALGVSRATVRRWIRDAHDLELDDVGMRILRRRAILRGHGSYLWPSPGAQFLARERVQLDYARRSHEALLSAGMAGAGEWAANGHLETHVVAVVRYPKAHVFGVTSARTYKALEKVKRVGEIVQSRTVDSKFAAKLVKLRTLERAAEHRCIVPRDMVPSGRTEVWREAAGPVRLMVPRVASGKIQRP